jgi:hypothetical protein
MTAGGDLYAGRKNKAVLELSCSDEEVQKVCNV